MESIDLRRRKALVVGVANADSLAWWAAKLGLLLMGATRGGAWMNDMKKSKAGGQSNEGQLAIVVWGY